MGFSQPKAIHISLRFLNNDKQMSESVPRIVTLVLFGVLPVWPDNCERNPRGRFTTKWHQCVIIDRIDLFLAKRNALKSPP